MKTLALIEKLTDQLTAAEVFEKMAANDKGFALGFFGAYLQGFKAKQMKQHRIHAKCAARCRAAAKKTALQIANQC
jgi:hypothetical protein